MSLFSFLQDPFAVSNYAIKGTAAWTWHSNQKQSASMRRSLILVVRRMRFLLFIPLLLVFGCASYLRQAPVVKTFYSTQQGWTIWSRPNDKVKWVYNRKQIQHDLWACARTLPDMPRSNPGRTVERDLIFKCMETRGWEATVITTHKTCRGGCEDPEE